MERFPAQTGSCKVGARSVLVLGRCVCSEKSSKCCFCHHNDLHKHFFFHLCGEIVEINGKLVQVWVSSEHFPSFCQEAPQTTASRRTKRLALVFLFEEPARSLEDPTTRFKTDRNVASGSSDRGLQGRDAQKVLYLISRKRMQHLLHFRNRTKQQLACDANSADNQGGLVQER